MEKPTHLPVTPPEATDADATRSAPSARENPGPATQKSQAANGGRFVGSAMKALFEASDVSIKRGDETRVMSRAQEQLEELHRRYPSSRPPPSNEDPLRRSPSSSPPGPRVDVVLWIVLAVGLFAIAGWMIASGLR